jgi:hypothetical protein
LSEAGPTPSTETARVRRSAEPSSSALWLARFPAHPFLLAAYAVFALYASNLRETGFDDVAPSLVVVLGLTGAAFLGLGLLFRSFGARAALVTSVLVVGALFYVELLSWLNRTFGAHLTAADAWPWMLTVGAILGAAVALAPVSLTLPNSILNGIAVALIVGPAWKVGAYEVETARENWAAQAMWSDAPDLAPVGTAHAAPLLTGERPDIYYFIFDRYASDATLRGDLGFDNDLTDFLTEHGFYIAAESRANYLKTAHSLASTFHMDYINFLSDDPRSARDDWHPIYDMLENHRVGRFLKERGYDFIQMGGWWGPTQHNRQADENYSYGFGEFETHLLRKTILPPMLNAAAPDSGVVRKLQWDAGQCQRIPAQFQKLKEIAARPGPTFAFTHLLLPHEPFVFDAQGKCLPLAEREIDFKTGYLGQLRYANSLIEDFVLHVLAKDGPKPVIVIQADEGPFPARYRTGSRSWRAASRVELQMKTGILNAYYFPDGDYAALYPDITPINTFRTVFNEVFGTEFERLPDRVYAFPDVFRIYDFYDITDVVHEHLD